MTNLLKWLSIRKSHSFSSAYKELCYESKNLFCIPRNEATQTGYTEVRIFHKCNEKRTKGDTSSEILHHIYNIQDIIFEVLSSLLSKNGMMKIMLGSWN